MASSWQFPRWRRVLMQGVLWLVFVAMLALAALVNHQVRKALIVRLGDVIQLDRFQLRLPSQWNITPITDVNSRGLRAQEPAKYGRTLEIRIYAVSEPISAEEFAGKLKMRMSANSDEETTIMIAGQPGALFANVIDLEVPGGLLRGKSLVAGAMVPQGYAVVIELSGYNDIDPTDRALINDVAASIQLPAPVEGETVESTLSFPLGMQLRLPQGASVAKQNDPLVTERQLTLGSADQRASINITSLLLHPEASNDAVRSVLMARDPAWGSADVTTTGEGQWRAQRGEDENKTIAFLRARPDGRAVVAVIHSKDEAQANEAWASVEAGLSFTGNFDFSALLAAGLTQATTFSQQGLDELISESTSNDWWQWTRSQPETIVGWTRVQYDPASPRHLLRESRWFSSGHVMQAVEEVETSANLREYSCRLQQSRSDADGEGGFDPLVSGNVQLRQGKLEMTMESQFAKGRFEGAALPQFLPGAWLPMLLGRAEPAPMILMTDTFPGQEDQPVLEPLVLIIEPTTENPRTLAGETKPMRCLRIALNGTGRSSRWYFNARSELEMIDLPGGITRVRCTESKVRFDFGKDPRMLPPGRTF